MSSQIYSHIIVGGGSAGCVLANRLSARSTHRVLLIEAGIDTPPDQVPDDIAAAYAGRAAMNPNYIWRGLTADLAGSGFKTGSYIASYEQARVMGGGSSINGQIATRGAPADYDLWAEMGAEGWDWHSVLPYFRRLERDLDFDNEWHGQDGPIPLTRTPRDKWDGFSTAIAKALEDQGIPFNQDINSEFLEGVAATPINTFSNRRVSAATAYLDASARSRKNLDIWPGTFVRRIVFDGRRARGVEVDTASGRQVIEGKEIILSAGAILSPTLLMRSGVGSAERLREHGIDVVADHPQVGENLQEHGAVHVSAYLEPSARIKDLSSRHNVIYQRYSSGIPDTRSPDMLLNFACRSGWHAVGVRLATIQGYILQPFSKGSVRLRSPDPHTLPEVNLNLLGDVRDANRLEDAVRLSIALFRTPPVSDIAKDPFATSYSDRVRKLGRDTLYNRLSTRALAHLLDMPAPIRRTLINRLVSDADSTDVLLKDAQALREHVRKSVSGVWHPTGTCRMGRVDDPAAVTDPQGRVKGLDGLRVADNSLIPEIPRGNTNLPAMMIGERISDLIVQSG